MKPPIAKLKPADLAAVIRYFRAKGLVRGLVVKTRGKA